MTIKELISDVELQLYQGDVSDDSVLTWKQLKAWLTQDANELVATELNSKLAMSEFIPPMYLVRESCKVAELEEGECGDCQDRIKVTLNSEVLSLNNDGGVVIVSTEDGDQIKKAGSISMLTLLQGMKFAKPSEDNPAYTREGEIIYIDGFKEADIPFDNINVIYVPRKNYSVAAETDTVVVSDLILPILIDSLVQRGKLMLYGTQVDQQNDGVDPKNPVYHQQISNPEK